MKTLRANLEKLRKEERKRHHVLVNKIHKEYNISKKTLFYVKEYGPHTNVLRTIMKESIKILLFASIISSFGGLILENIKLVFISIMPLLILLPALNDMVGDYGTIISSRFSAMLHEGKVTGSGWRIKELKELFIQLVIVSLFTSVLSVIIALAVSGFSGYEIRTETISKVLFITLLDVLFILGVLFLVCIFAGLYFYKKREDPNNFLIPISTSVADFVNMFMLAGLIMLFF